MAATVTVSSTRALSRLVLVLSRCATPTLKGKSISARYTKANASAIAGTVFFMVTPYAGTSRIRFCGCDLSVRRTHPGLDENLHHFSAEECRPPRVESGAWHIVCPVIEAYRRSLTCRFGKSWSS